MSAVSCFKVIKAVLDEQYPLIPDDRVPRDAQIGIARARLRRIFKNLASSTERPDYSDPAIRFAYVYTYVSAHANCLFQLIEESSVLAEVFDQETVEMACVGGGPGSDFLGVLKYMLTYDKQPDKLMCQILDGERSWSDTWRDVEDELPAPAASYVSTHFDAIDVTDRETWETYYRYLASDLFTLSYFMSELCHMRDETDPFFDNLFSGSQPGALFLYVDNHGMSDWFDDLAFTHGLDVLVAEARRFTMADLSEEEKTDLGVYYNKFQWPKMTAHIDFRICRKPETATQEIPF
jgi:hypothetical protein